MSNNIFRIVFFFGVLMSSLCSYAQHSRQELEAVVNQNIPDTAQYDALIELYLLDSEVDMKRAKTHLDKAMGIARKMNDQKGVAFVFRVYGDYYSWSGELSTAKNVLNKGKVIYHALGDNSGESSCLIAIGSVLLKEGDFSSALYYFIEAAQLAEATGNLKLLAAANHNIGGMHYDQGRYDMALNYWKKSLSIEQSRGDSVGMVQALNAISVVYTTTGEYNKALEMQHATLKIANIVASTAEIAPILNNIGVQHQYNKVADSAIFYYKKALELYKVIKDKQGMAIEFVNLGRIEANLKNGAASKAYYDSSLTLSQSMGFHQIMEQAYGGLADANRILGEYETAFDWLNKSHQLQDSLMGVQVKFQLNELQEKYETEQKDKEIAEMAKRETNAVLLADKRMSFLIIVISLTISLGIILILYLGRRRAREQRDKAKLEQKALRTQMNPHFIFNSLGAIQELYVSGEIDLANDYMSDFGSLMRKILVNSGKEVISVKEELTMLRLYLELEKGRSNNVLDFEISVDDQLDQLGTKIPPMIIPPFVENAIWHGILPSKKAGKVWVRLKPSKNTTTLICEIEDNGVGIQKDVIRKDHESKGILLTEQRLRSKIKIENLTPGTRITLKITV